MAKKTNPVVWFEIPVKNLKRAVRFYEGVFGMRLKVEAMGPMKMAMFPGKPEAPGTPGSLVKSKAYKPSLTGMTVYFSVPSVAAAIRKVRARGGKVLMPRTSIGKWGGFIAQFKDTEGNRVALHSMK
jgi:hypothetical protein